MPLHTNLFIESNPAPTKYALSLPGANATPMPLFLTVLAIRSPVIARLRDDLMGPVVSLLLERLSLRCMFPS